MQFTVYNKFIEKVFNGEVNLNTATIKVALVNDPANSGYSDISLQEDAANLAAFTGGMSTGFNAGGHEFDGMAYVRGTLAKAVGDIVVRDDAANRIKVTADEQDFGALDDDGSGYGIGGVLLILHVDGTEANDVPIALLPWTKTPDGSNFTVPWPSSGLFYFKGSGNVTFYNVFLEKLLTAGIDLETQTVKAALVNKVSNTGYSNIATQLAADNLAAFTGGSSGGFNAGDHEFDGSAYVRGTLAGVSVTRDTATNQIKFDANDQDFGSIDDDGSGYGVGQVLVLAHVDGTEANDFPIAIMDYSKTPDGSNYTVVWQEIGLFAGQQIAA